MHQVYKKQQAAEDEATVAYSHGRKLGALIHIIFIHKTYSSNCPITYGLFVDFISL